MLLAAGCGGKSGLRTMTGDGYSFNAPGRWAVTRGPTAIEAADGARVVSVTIFRLKHPFRPALWPRAVRELDGVAAGLADQLRGSSTGSTVTVAGRRARRYDISFERGGDTYVERITFVLDGSREYQLLCRYREGDDERPCAALGSSFRLR